MFVNIWSMFGFLSHFRTKDTAGNQGKGTEGTFDRATADDIARRFSDGLLVVGSKPAATGFHFW